MTVASVVVGAAVRLVGADDDELGLVNALHAAQLGRQHLKVRRRPAQHDHLHAQVVGQVNVACSTRPIVSVRAARRASGRSAGSCGGRRPASGSRPRRPRRPRSPGWSAARGSVGARPRCGWRTCPPRRRRRTGRADPIPATRKTERVPTRFTSDPTIPSLYQAGRAAHTVFFPTRPARCGCARPVRLRLPQERVGGWRRRKWDRLLEPVAVPNLPIGMPQ